MRHLCGLLVVLLAVGGCAKKTPLSPDVLSAVVVEYSGGHLRKADPLRVQFVDAMVDAEQVGKPLQASPFTLSPHVPGVAVFVTPTVLEFRPEKQWKSNAEYGVRLDIASVARKGTPASAVKAPMAFSFHVLEPALQVRMDGLQSTGETSHEFTGQITTSDTVDNTALEKTLRAQWLGKPSVIRWTHDASGLNHYFSVTSLARQEKQETLTLVWDGTPVGAKQSGTEEIPVPGLDAFVVTQVRTVTEGARCVEIVFSDPVLASQNMKGLVALGENPSPSVKIENNVVRVYVDDGLAEVNLKIAPSIVNTRGVSLKTPYEEKVFFAARMPSLRFGSRGAVVPSDVRGSIPLETLNVKAVTVRAVAVPPRNIPQFLQVNTLGGSLEMIRVGRVVWQKHVPVEGAKFNTLHRMGLDVGPLVEKFGQGLYRLEVSFGPEDIAYTCDAQATVAPSVVEQPEEDPEEESSSWDNVVNEEYVYEDNNNPCKPSYYRSWNTDVYAGRNVLVSNIGLMGKVAPDHSVTVVAAHLGTGAPLEGVEFEVLDYQQEVLGRAISGTDGVASFKADRQPFLVVAKHKGEWGYVRLNTSDTLSLSHFDVGGVQTHQGLRGKIYGERGVWRPGDTMHLTFVLWDAEKRLPENHPVTFELLDPRGQRVLTRVAKQGVGGMYPFAVATGLHAPTGRYMARVSVGGATFEEPLSVETVRPNRVSVEHAFKNADMLEKETMVYDVLGVNTQAQWLHGAPARLLRFDVKMSLAPRKTVFSKWSGYRFDDTTRTFSSEQKELASGALDAEGRAFWQGDLSTDEVAGGMLTATLTTRVFESSGVFSIDRSQVVVSPFKTYVGMHVPEGDKARGMLLTDKKHTVDIVAVDRLGALQPNTEVTVQLYKLQWRWWWEKGEDNIAEYMGSEAAQPVDTGTVTLTHGRGSWPLLVKYPEWGRYLLVVEDTQGGHRSSQIFYIDWPGWAGRPSASSQDGATVLQFSADKEQYRLGDEVRLTIPTPYAGQLWVSLETSEKVLSVQRQTTTPEKTVFAFKTTEAMAPNVYAHVTYVQGYTARKNDAPLRVYGVIPINVSNEATHLEPLITTSSRWEPESTQTIKIKEAHGKPMHYTLALVDEGLLNLTRFNTPTLWEHFYARGALNVRSFDVFGEVAGVYGAKLESLLAIGGSDDASDADPTAMRTQRFVPVVQYLGPYTLEAGAAATHKVDVPLYVGALRVMVVAAHEGAFGGASESVVVKKPLMVAAGFPRVMGTEERVDAAVTVFNMGEKAQDVAVKLEVEGFVRTKGVTSKRVKLHAGEERTVYFDVESGVKTGPSTLVFSAQAGSLKARAVEHFDVRAAGVKTTRVLSKTLASGETWNASVTPFGIAMTNSAELEVSRIGSLNLKQHLQALLEYPHGCVEQTTSKAFPQLYLSDVMPLTPEQAQQAQSNVQSALAALASFQTNDGGFGYWPGEEHAHAWATDYVGHFLVEAKNKGYLVPSEMFSRWQAREKTMAQRYSGGGNTSEQAYRLYVLALAGQADLGAMNRLRGSTKWDAPTRDLLAASYAQVGQKAVAVELLKKKTTASQDASYETFASPLRDKALYLKTLLLVQNSARAASVAQEIVDMLGKARWLGTHETAWALFALAGLMGDSSGALSLTWAVDQTASQKAATSKSMWSVPLGRKDTARTVVVKNTGTGPLFAHVLVHGVPAFGKDEAYDEGVALKVSYTSPDGGPVDIQKLMAGDDVVVHVSVSNTSNSDLHHVALVVPLASGWELSQVVAEPVAEYQDLRDDLARVYFSLQKGASTQVDVWFNAAFSGHYYVPACTVEGMYDPSVSARVPGKWTDVVAFDKTVAKK